MKKFLKKNDKFKIIGIFLCLAMLFSWICTVCYYSADGLVEPNNIKTLGLFDFFSVTEQAFKYFFIPMIFLLIVAGFYKFVGSLDEYKNITTKLADSFNNSKKLTIGVMMFIFAILASILTDYFVLLAIIPFTLTILSKMKVDKITAVSTTFGGMLIGILGSTCSGKVTQYLVDAEIGYKGLEYGFEIESTIVLLLIAYIVLLSLTLMRLNNKVNKEDELKDLFESIEDKKIVKKNNNSILPMSFVFVIGFIIMLLGFIDWNGVFGVKVFDNFHNDLMGTSIGTFKVFKYLIGVNNAAAFGSWTLSMASGILVVMMIAIIIAYRVSFDKFIDEFINGIKRFAKPFAVYFVILMVIMISASVPTIAGLMSRIIDSGVNMFTMLFSSFLSSFMLVDFYYVMEFIGAAFANYENLNVAAIAMQAGYGLFSLIAPTSIILMLGLSMADIKYTDWFKFIWKLVAILFVVVLVILSIIMYF